MLMSTTREQLTRFALILSAGLGTSAFAQDPEPREVRWDFGYRAGVILGKGEPANDLTVLGNLFARRSLGEMWALEGWIETVSGDFERPAKSIGLEQDTSLAAIDADLSILSFGLACERSLCETERSNLFGLLGVGLSSIDAGDASGPLQGGGTFDIRTDGGTEGLLTLGVGYRHSFSRKWSFEAQARYDRHLADWELDDRVSGVSGSIDDYSTWGFLLGLSFSP